MTLARRDRWLAAGVVTVHALVSGAHGVTHGTVPVGLAAWQWAFVLVVSGLAPVVALVLLWRGREAAGSALLAGSMAGAFAFGLLFHFLVPNPDHVASVVGPWALPFEVTAVLIAVSEFAGAALGVWLWTRARTRSGATGTAAA